MEESRRISFRAGAAQKVPRASQLLEFQRTTKRFHFFTKKMSLALIFSKLSLHIKCFYTHTHTHTHAHAIIYIFAFLSESLCTCVYVWVCVYLCVYMCVYDVYIYVCELVDGG